MEKSFTFDGILIKAKFINLTRLDSLRIITSEALDNLITSIKIRD